jgi:uncharacterized protein YbcC (UPF0753/DUF2309 family)
MKVNESKSVNNARGRVDAILEHAAHFLPEQAPLQAFVHHNTLHAFQHLPFDEALAQASALFGTESYQTEQAFAEHLSSGRITTADIDNVLALEEGLSEQLWNNGPTRLELWRRRLLDIFELPDSQTIAWIISEGEPFKDLHPSVSPLAKAMWLDHIAELQKLDTKTTLTEKLRQLWVMVLATTPNEKGSVVGKRKRDIVLDIIGKDIDVLVRPMLIRLASAYLDQGVATVPMPEREFGFLKAFQNLYKKKGFTAEPWAKKLPAKISEQIVDNLDAVDIIVWALREQSVPEEHWDEVILQTMLALKGWAGMFRQCEKFPERLPVHSSNASLADFLAVQLTLEVLAIDYVLECSKESDSYTGLSHSYADQTITKDNLVDMVLAYEIFVFAQSLGFVGTQLSQQKIEVLVKEIAEFDSRKRRSLLHKAYELNFRDRVLNALAANQKLSASQSRPRVQAVFCMDEREESFRRHLEELEPQSETYGFAGFFGVAMSYRGLDDLRERPLCPVVVKPKHLIEELSLDEFGVSTYSRSKNWRGRFSKITSTVRDSVFFGGLWALSVGTLKILPLVGLAVFPRVFSGIAHRIQLIGIKRPATRLRIEYKGENDPASGLRLGYSIEEMTDIVFGVLSTMGLRKKFADIVMIVGHGSSSLNNPHEAAHDCGATGGGRGGPNARAFAAMANHSDVRKSLLNKGIEIPLSTHFVGAYHNTCDDSMLYYDTDLVPQAILGEFKELRELFALACQRDAHERCRRFESAPRSLQIKDALYHAEEHAADLGQPRPEYGHASNAVCVIGRREASRGLFLDRRAFLISYDPETDKNGEALGPLLAAAGPVGAGISLEYYFSFIDPDGYGCGTKLPHNITGLIGVMDGHASDLRTGLPWQMVEIHEPMRLLIIVEATVKNLISIVEKYPGVAQLVLNGWVQLVNVDPETREMQVFEGTEFCPFIPQQQTLPTVTTSMDWYAGHRKHLDIARINGVISHAV